MSESPATSALTAAFGSQPKKSSFERQQRRSTAIARKITSDENPSKRVDQRNRLFSSDVIEFQQLKIEEAKRHKRAAQELYNRGDFFDSLTHLHKAVKNFKVQQLDEQLLRENEAVYRIIRECYLFSASCYIKINQFEQAVNILTQIIDVEPSNIKALYLRGKAGLLLGEVLQAYHDFQAALEVDPQNTLIKNYLSSLVNQFYKFLD